MSNKLISGKRYVYFRRVDLVGGSTQTLSTSTAANPASQVRRFLDGNMYLAGYLKNRLRVVSSPDAAYAISTMTVFSTTGPILLQPYLPEDLLSVTYDDDYFLMAGVNERKLNRKLYELTDHLGNVRAVVTDEKEITLSAGVPQDYTPVVRSGQNYYPFGSTMPGRVFNSGDYRYGFNGMEKDDVVKGSGNSYTTMFRQYDPRLGRWLSIDPEFKLTPFNSPYLSFSNNPIINVDPYGDTDYYNLKGKKVGSDGEKNGLIGIVHSRKVARDMKKGNIDLPKNPANGTKFDGGFIIHKDILSKTVEMSGMTRSNQEISTTLNKNSEGGYSSTGILEGPIVDLSKPNQAASVPVADGEISIHTHPTGYDKTSFDSDPSFRTDDNDNKNDQQMFKEHEMNIIIGMEHEAQSVAPGLPQMTQGEKEIKVFGNSAEKPIGTITSKSAEKIDKKVQR